MFDLGRTLALLCTLSFVGRLKLILGHKPIFQVLRFASFTRLGISG